MRINEVENSKPLDPAKLKGLVDFLSGRADDENAQKQISTDAFISAARSLGFPVSEKNIVSIVSQPPLDSVLEPMDSQNPTIIKYKGAAPDVAPKMPVNKAQDIVAASAKQAAGKDRGV
jgi:hypothetical protein